MVCKATMALVQDVGVSSPVGATVWGSWWLGVLSLHPEVAFFPSGDKWLPCRKPAPLRAIADLESTLEVWPSRASLEPDSSCVLPKQGQSCLPRSTSVEHWCLRPWERERELIPSVCTAKGTETKERNKTSSKGLVT